MAFSTADPEPGSGLTDWSQVKSVRIALGSKSETGTVALGVPRPSRSIRGLAIPLPILRGTKKIGLATSKPTCIDGARPPTPDWLASRRTLRLPVRGLNASCSIYISSRAGFRQVSATAVRLRRTGTERWSYSLSARQPGVLVWTQAYDPLWALSGAGAGNAPLPVLSLLDGYFVGAGHHAGTIAFASGPSVAEGLAVTLLALPVLLLIAIIGGCRKRSGRALRSLADPSRPEPLDGKPLEPPARLAPDLCLAATSVFLVLCPIASLAGFTGLILPLSALALLAAGASAVLIAFSRTSSPPQEPDPAVSSEGQDLDAALR